MNYNDNMGISLIGADGSDLTYSFRLFDRHVKTVVTDDPNTMAKWIGCTLKSYGDRRDSLVVGLAIEWCNPEPDTDTVKQWKRPRVRSMDLATPPATIQLCVGHRCIIFQLCHSLDIPCQLSEFLQDPNIIFVGVRDWHDRSRLTTHYGLFVRNAREIRHLASLKMGCQGATVEELAEKIFGYGGVCKSVRIDRSDWRARDLSHEQVMYASLDAYLAFLLGLRLVWGK